MDMIKYQYDLEERDKYAEELVGEIEINSTKLPTFTQWTLVDVASCRIYGVFDDAKEIEALITHPKLSALLRKIVHERNVIVYVPEKDRNRIGYESCNPYSAIQLRKGDIFVGVSHTVDGTPTKWDIGESTNQWVNTTVTTQELIETRFDTETIRKMAEESDYAF